MYIIFVYSILSLHDSWLYVWNGDRNICKNLMVLDPFLIKYGHIKNKKMFELNIFIRPNPVKEYNKIVYKHYIIPIK